MKRSELAIHNLVKDFVQGAVTLNVLQGISVTFVQGQSYAITGISGSGKSTFLHVASGLDVPTAGNVLFNGADINVFTQKERELFFNTNIGFMFQLPYLLRELSVVENVMLKGLIQGVNHATCLQEATTLLEQVGLGDKLHAHPLSLSGGQQQRVALARALFGKPSFLIADEPTGNLDEKTGKTIVDLLGSCKQLWGMGLIVSSHDAYVAQEMEHVFVMKNGDLVPVNAK